MEEDQHDSDNFSSEGEEEIEEVQGNVVQIEAPQNRKKLNTVVDKLDQILVRDESQVLLAKLEKIIEKKKKMDEEKMERNIASVTAEDLEQVKQIIVKAITMNKRGLPREALALLKKAAIILPEHQKLKERIASLERKVL